jgi:uncharacterized membrane protein
MLLGAGEKCASLGGVLLGEAKQVLLQRPGAAGGQPGEPSGRGLTSSHAGGSFPGELPLFDSPFPSTTAPQPKTARARVAGRQADATAAAPLSSHWLAGRHLLRCRDSISSENLMTAGVPSVLLSNVSASPLLRPFALGLMVLLLLSAGTTHFLRPASFVQIVPPFVPFPLAVVYLSGGAELLLGLGLLVPRLSRPAALAVVLLLVAVFPANVYHWLADVHVDGSAAPGWYHPVRIPAQGLLIAWAFWLSRPARRPELESSNSPAAPGRPPA